MATIPGDPRLLNKATVAATYPLMMTLVAAERGIALERVLEDSGLTREQLMVPGARVALPQLTAMAINLLMESGDAGIGIELALRGNLTRIGLMGFGLMSCSTMREAIELGCRYLPTVVSFFSASFSVQNGQSVVDVRETFGLGALRQFLFDVYLVEAASVYASLAEPQTAALIRERSELWFNYPEPEYYAPFRDRLPKLRFDAPACQIRMDAALLDLPIRTANPVTAQMVMDQCERELARMGLSESLLDQVRAHLVCRNGRYPDVETVAERLHLSERTLKRKLAALGLGFAELLDEVRKRDALRLLEDPGRGIDDVALRVGYNDPANFTRAFRKWTGETPSAYRARAGGRGAAEDSGEPPM
jgi:AraC-like DNA-binding protein